MDFKPMSANFPGRVFLPESIEFTESTSSYFAAFENELSPICVVQPHSARELANVIKYLRRSALYKAIPIAIRSGGHTPWAGAANVDRGVVLDLRKINGIELSSDTKVVSIKAGERWGNVYEKLGSKGLTVAGGRVSKVGVSGLILGGGLSFFSAAKGFVCDNILNFEVVLSSGEIVQANARSHEDLFVALKGGSNNFGVVTSFDMPTFEQGKMWGGSIMYGSGVYSQLVQAFYDFASLSPADEHAHIIVANGWTAGQDIGFATLISCTPKAAPPSLVPFTEIQPQQFNSLQENSLLGLVAEQSAFSSDGKRQLYFTTTFRLDLQLMHDIRGLWLEALKPLKPIDGLVLSLVFQPLTTGILAKSKQCGENSLGLDLEESPLVVVLLNSIHANASDDDKIVAAVLGLIKSIDSLSTERGKAARYRFMNYAYKDQQVVEGYGHDSVTRLEEVSKKYDPSGFFQSTVSGGFKLPKF